MPRRAFCCAGTRDTLPNHPFATRKGRAFRDRILLRDLYTCQMCGDLLRDGRTDGRSAVVDHTRPRELRPDLTWDESNCRSVCRDCHAICDSIEKRLKPDADAIARAKATHRPRLRFDAQGRPIWPEGR